MDETAAPGWPGDDAARDGAPLETGYGPADPRLVAAERVIRQLRTLLAAVVAQAGVDEVDVPAGVLADDRLRGMRIVADHDRVRVVLPPGDDHDGVAASGHDPRGQQVDGDTPTAESPQARENPPVGDHAGRPRSRYAARTVRHGAGRPTEMARPGETPLMSRLERLLAERAGGVGEDTDGPSGPDTSP